MDLERQLNTLPEQLTVTASLEPAAAAATEHVTARTAAEANDAARLWLDALAGLEVKRELERKGMQRLGIVIAAVGVISMTALLFYFHEAMGWLYALMALLVILAGLGIFFGSNPKELAKSSWYKQQALALQTMYEQLEGSGIAQRLLDGFYEQDVVFDHVPAYFRWLLPRSRPGDRQAVLDRISANLNWYLGPPRRFTRISWTQPFLMLPSTLMFSVPVFFNHLSGSTGMISAIPGVMMLSFSFIAGYIGGLQLGQTQTPLLSKYLRHEWSTPALSAPDGTEAASGEAGALGDLRVDRRHNVSLNLILNQLQQDVQVGMTKRMVFVMAPVLCGLSFLLFPGFGTAFQDPLTMLFMLLLMLAGIGTVAVAGPQYLNRRRKELQPELERRLEASELTASMLAGESREDLLLEHTPWPFNEWLRFDRPPPAYASGLRRTLWRVATNLEWFMKPAERYIPVVMLCRLGYFVLGLAFFATLGMWFFNMFNSVNLGSAVPSIGWPLGQLAILGASVAWIDYQRLIRDWAGAEALVNVLRRSLKD